MEQFFSYLAKCGLTTKNMNAAARIDTLTEHTAFWNGRKVENLAASLGMQYEKTKKKLARIIKEKDDLVSQCEIPITESMISYWEESLRNNAQSIWTFDNSFTNVMAHA